MEAYCLYSFFMVYDKIIMDGDMMIKIKNDNNPKLKKEIDSRLSLFNKEHCEWFYDKSKKNEDEYLEEECNFLVYDDENLIGGAIGFIKYKWYFLDLLYVDEKYRGNNIGTSLINEIEKVAKKKNLIGVRMETWDFQAKDFYEKNGYEVYATFEDCPPGTVDNFLRKKI